MVSAALHGSDSCVATASVSASHRAPVFEVFQNLQSFSDDVMRLVAFHIDNKPDPAGVMFEARVVEALFLGKTGVLLACFLGSAHDVLLLLTHNKQ